MLLNNLFTLIDTQTNGTLIEAGISLDAAHAIFEGHFPSQPVLPGVCMVHMVKEILEVNLCKPTRLVKAADIKFLAFVDPVKTTQIRMEIKLSTEADLIKVDAQLLDGAAVLFKFKGTFV